MHAEGKSTQPHLQDVRVQLVQLGGHGLPADALAVAGVVDAQVVRDQDIPVPRRPQRWQQALLPCADLSIVYSIHE